MTDQELLAQIAPGIAKVASDLLADHRALAEALEAFRVKQGNFGLIVALRMYLKACEEAETVTPSIPQE